MRQFLAALLLCVAATAPASAANVTVISADLASVVHEMESFATDTATSTDFDNFTLSVSRNGMFSSTDVNWQDTGPGALFNFDFSHVRSGEIFYYAQSYGFIYFQVGERNSTYSLSGLYATTGPSNLTNVEVFLYDGGTYIFRDYTQSRTNTSFVLGAAGDGDVGADEVRGSLTGTLLAEHTYLLFFSHYIQANPLADSGATATGCLTFSIDGATSSGDCGAAPAPVPLPAAAWLLLSGLGGLGFMGRRRKVA